MAVEAAGHEFQRQRAELVLKLRADHQLHDPRVADVIAAVPREEFLPPIARPNAYWDQPLDIGQGQTISAPHMVAIMSEALRVEVGQRVLEVGTGSGYQAAVLSRLVGPSGSVITIERHRALAERARADLRRVGADNVQTIVGDGSVGHPAGAPYDRIVVTAAAPALPPPLLEQLSGNGILLAPIGRQRCTLIRARKTSAGLVEESLGACAFVPLKGVHGHRFRLFGK